ncbi:type I polyketide synthase, partial [Stigmatella aurantiaca]
VISEALANANVAPETISYIETHGTGTALGDPIEVHALNTAFGGQDLPRQSCILGALKANIGHLDAAAGVCGLIKASLALHHRQLPPHPLYEEPNPHIPWEEGPFYVNTDLMDWKAGASPRRAGVSSFGMGGTNAHVILEEAPKRSPSDPSRALQLLPLSAATPTALDALTERLASFLHKHAEIPLADVAYTLQVGRRALEYRRVLVCGSTTDAEEGLTGASSTRRLLSGSTVATGAPVVFLFPGQGAQHPAMGAGLYESEPVFREYVDACARALQPHLGLDLRELLRAPQDSTAQARLEQTRLAQAALFTVEYALARLWMSWGIEPEAMMGHSIGEYVAACLSGVLSLDDALALVAARGSLMQELPPGAMLSVAMDEAGLRPLLGPRLAIAAINAPSLCVVSGPPEDVRSLQEELTRNGTACRVLHTAHAFHSPMVEPILERFAQIVRKVKLETPRLPYVSNLTGQWITPEQARNPQYWVDHLRQCVRFAPGLETLGRKPGRVLLEVGPGRTLSTLARRMPVPSGPWTVVTSMRHPDELIPDAQVLHEALGSLWLAGASVNWKGYHGNARRHRVALPTYPFERQRYWISPDVQAQGVPGGETPAELGQPPATTATTGMPSPDAARHPRPRLRNAFVAPRDEQEHMVARVFEEVLGIEAVGIHDNFFELGGHSLLATAVVGRLRDGSGVSIPLQLLFEGPTVAQVAERLGGLSWRPPNEDPERDALLLMLAELIRLETPSAP